MDSSVGRVDGGRSGWKVCPGQATTTSERHLERRPARALGLAQLEECSSARQALEGAAVAPGDEKTRKALSDETQEAQEAKAPLGRRSSHSGSSPDLLVLDTELLMKTLRSAKQGSAGGLSGMTVEHLRPLLKSGVCTQRCWGKSPPSSQGVKFQKKFSLR